MPSPACDFSAETRGSPVELDWLGFGTLSLAIGALQLSWIVANNDWFGSGEILIEAVIAAWAFYFSSSTPSLRRAPFLRPSLFKDRNFFGRDSFIAILGLACFASLALQPPFLQI